MFNFFNVGGKMEKTLCIVKPDAFEYIGSIWNILTLKELQPIRAKILYPNEWSPKKFYKEHEEEEFFPGLIEFMESGPILVMVLEGTNAINRYRVLMGDTDPAKAKRLTIRATFGLNCPSNAVHGSDSTESAKREIEFFFGREG